MTIHHASASQGRLHSVPAPQSHLQAPYSTIRVARAHRTRVGFVSSEHRRFAQTLNLNRVAWLYKPRTFAIDWDSDGNLLDSITPDFYLSDCRQYVQLPPADQPCVADTARRLRLLSRVHPELDVHLIVGKNYADAIKRLVRGVDKF